VLLLPAVLVLIPQVEGLPASRTAFKHKAFYGGIRQKLVAASGEQRPKRRVQNPVQHGSVGDVDHSIPPDTTKGATASQSAPAWLV
jgi:hypothetical protein